MGVRTNTKIVFQSAKSTNLLILSSGWIVLRSTPGEGLFLYPDTRCLYFRHDTIHYVRCIVRNGIKEDEVGRHIFFTQRKSVSKNIAWRSNKEWQKTFVLWSQLLTTNWEVAMLKGQCHQKISPKVRVQKFNWLFSWLFSWIGGTKCQ